MWIFGSLAILVFVCSSYLYLKNKQHQYATVDIKPITSPPIGSQPETTSKDKRSGVRRAKIQYFVNGTITMPSIQEFALLDEEYGEGTKFLCLHGSLEKNKQLNLVQDVLPFDYNRVRLLDRSGTTNYINASWIRKLKAKEKLDCLPSHPYLPPSNVNVIVSQDPIKETLEDYYVMIFQQNIKLVIQISDTNIPADKVSNPNISPPGVSKTFINHCKITEYLIKESWNVANRENESKSVIYLRLKGWPTEQQLSEDMINKILTTIAITRKELGINMRERATILAHDDQGGISGAAVFIALYDLLEVIDNEMVSTDSSFKTVKEGSKNLDVFRFVKDLRRKRDKMINYFDEYQFLFRALVHYAQNMSYYEKYLPPRNVMNTWVVENAIETALGSRRPNVEYVLHHET